MIAARAGAWLAQHARLMPLAAVLAALTPLLVLADAPAHPHWRALAIAGLGGLLLGLRAGARSGAIGRAVDGAGAGRTQHAASLRAGVGAGGRAVDGAGVGPGHAIRRMITGAIGRTPHVASLLVLLLAVADALPPLALVAGDLGQIGTWGWQSLVGLWAGIGTADLPNLGTPLFAAAALPRLAGDLWAMRLALIFPLVQVGLTALGGWWCGISVTHGPSATRAVLALLAACVLAAVPGGARTLALALGITALVWFLAVAAQHAREHRWQQDTIDYPDDLTLDVSVAALTLIGGALLLGWALPLRPDHPAVRWAQHLFTAPASATSAGGNPDTPAPIGLSDLPAVLLGRSLLQGEQERPALAITTTERDAAPRYWRARVLERYTGRAWASSAQVRARPADQIVNASADLVLQQITDLRSDRRLIVAAPGIIALDVVSSAERLPDGTTAALVSDRLLPGYRVLSRRSPEQIATGRDAPNLDLYLQLPPELPARVRELAQALTAQDDDPRSRAQTIERYLRTLPYTYTVEPLPARGDAVDQFLFTMRSGYCTYYASAMVVLARSSGIPARVAVGYSAGEFDTARGMILVRERDAHAWAELLIDGEWQVFEATPTLPLPARAAQTAPAPRAVPPVQVPFVLPRVAWQPLLAPATALSLLAAVAWLVWRARPAPAADRARRAIARAGRRVAIPWPAGATLREYATLLGPQIQQRAALDEAVALLERAGYAPGTLTPAEEQRLRRLSREVR